MTNPLCSKTDGINCAVVFYQDIDTFSRLRLCDLLFSHFCQ